MTKVHRELLAPLAPLRAVNLDSAYGFQLNVPQMSEKLEEYFKVSLGVDLTTLHFPSFLHASELERTLFKQQVRQANYVFAGPGSPTYALNQWYPLQLGDDLRSVLDHAGTLCFASAAALTLGAYTAPIYEAYKVGVEELHWRDGLNLLGALGLNCAVIPHFDNSEGGNYDTRFCYLGEPRLSELERQLPAGVAVLGVDEHTALIIDFDRGSLIVRGRSNAYWRLGGSTLVLHNETETPLSDLQNAVPLSTAPVAPVVPPGPVSPLDLAEAVAHGGDAGHDALAQLVQLASTGGQDFVDPTQLIEGVLRARVTARARGFYDLADELRDALVAAGFDVMDGAEGSTWSRSNHG